MSADPVIHLNGLNFAYPGGPPVLKDLRCEIQTGDVVALIGPNGAGKSTLFLCLAGVLPIACGTALIAGLDPGHNNQRRKLPGRLGIVFQDSDDQIFGSTVLDDVAFGPLNLGLPADEVRARVSESLAQVDLQGFEQRVPHHLSGGEKRRVALAGVLAMQPEVLLLDEPTMFLDARGRRELVHYLNKLGGTKLIATHDLEFVLTVCRRAVLLDGGTIVADGAATDLLRNAELMKAHGLEVPASLRLAKHEL